MFSLGMRPERRLIWSPTLERDPQACCTAQPSFVTTGRPPGQRSTLNKMC
uniref:2',3'-cyclic nucleotide 3' phosphodiesterase n=1 Tax=Cebus imitator TaxID=2715852 RepID=A0A2K5PHP2_CEBIM